MLGNVIAIAIAITIATAVLTTKTIAKATATPITIAVDFSTPIAVAVVAARPARAFERRHGAVPIVPATTPRAASKHAFVTVAATLALAVVEQRMAEQVAAGA